MHPAARKEKGRVPDAGGGCRALRTELAPSPTRRPPPQEGYNLRERGREPNWVESGNCRMLDGVDLHYGPNYMGRPAWLDHATQQLEAPAVVVFAARFTVKEEANVSSLSLRVTRFLRLILGHSPPSLLPKSVSFPVPHADIALSFL